MRFRGWRSPSRLSCREVGRRLQRYLDGELDEERIRLIGEHLEECRRCGMEAQAYRTIKASLARLASPAAADALGRLRGFAEQLAECGVGGPAFPDP